MFVQQVVSAGPKRLFSVYLDEILLLDNYLQLNTRAQGEKKCAQAAYRTI